MLLNNALLNYCLPEGQVLVCTERRERTEGVMMKEKEAEDEEPFQDFKYEKVALMCYISQDIIMIMIEWGDGWWVSPPKSAETGGRHGAVCCKAAATFT